MAVLSKVVPLTVTSPLSGLLSGPQSTAAGRSVSKHMSCMHGIGFLTFAGGGFPRPGFINLTHPSVSFLASLGNISHHKSVHRFGVHGQLCCQISSNPTYLITKVTNKVVS